MVRTRRMENGDRYSNARSSRNAGEGGGDDDDEEIDDDEEDVNGSNRHRTMVKRRKVRRDSSRDEDSIKSENCRETRSRLTKSEDNSNGEEESEEEEEEEEEKDKIKVVEVKGNGGGIRRSTRKKKFTYDSLNQNWLLEGGRIPEYHPYMNREERRLRRAKKMMEDEENGTFEDDMYTRIKRDRRKAAQRFYRSRESKTVKRKSKTSDGFISEEDDLANEDSGEGEEEEEETTTSIDEEEEDGQQIQDGVRSRKYYLRQKKPVTDRFQVQNEPAKLRNGCKSILHLSPAIRHIRPSNNFVTSFLSPAHRSPLMKRRLTTHNSSSESSSSCSEDERRFERQKAKSMAKARNRVLPMNLTADEIQASLIKKNRTKIGSSLADVDPMNVDKSVNFESVGGLVKHIQGLKEMLLLPLMYPDVFEKFKITPPRGVLFYGPPGTGKTLMARALANECSQSERKVSFFMRKGADCLSKWVGESERQLRLLFDQAYTMRPSIIFFDEIDGLAPVRSTRQDQIHSSIVSTLLALMDGLDNRGEVIVIGATNRIDAIDPALRRPGRFDREFNFSLPPCEARKSILNIHTKNWDPPLETMFVDELARRTTGYCGADLKALCAEAVFLALRRQFPEIYTSKQKLQLDVSHVKIEDEDFSKAVSSIVPAAQRSISSPARPMPPMLRPLLHRSLARTLQALRHVFPQGFRGSSVCPEAEGAAAEEEDGALDTGGWSLTHRPRLLLTGNSGQAQSTYVAPAVLHFLEKFPVYKLDLPSLFAVTAKSPEEACAQMFVEAQRLLPSVLYLPHCSQWWDTLTDTVKVTFLNLVQDVEPSAPLLILATADSPHDHLPLDLASVFDPAHGEVVTMSEPSEEERRDYFSHLILTAATKPPPTPHKRKRRRGGVLKPVAASSLPRAFTKSELKKLEEDEEGTMRELRLFLREVLYKIARDRRFSIFSKPVDTSEVSDYLQVIKSPMDLETMMTKIDMHKYQAVGEFLDDIDLVVANALEYNPDRFPSDKMIRHRACTLKDFAHALVNSELDLEFEKSCEEVREARKFRGLSPTAFAPKHCQAPPRPLPLPLPLPTPPEVVVVVDDSPDAQPTGSATNNLSSANSTSARVEVVSKEQKYRLLPVRRRKKNSPWLVARRRRRMVRPLKLQVYSEDSLDSKGTGGEEEGAFSFDQAPPHPTTTELNSNESVDSLSSNNLSSLSNTDDQLITNPPPPPPQSPTHTLHDEHVINKESDAKPDVISEEAGEPEASKVEPEVEAEGASSPAEVQAEVKTEVEEEVKEEEEEEVVVSSSSEAEEAVPELQVDRKRLEGVVEGLVRATRGLQVGPLERLFCRLSRTVYAHRNNYDRTPMLNELEAEVKQLQSGSTKHNKL